MPTASVKPYISDGSARTRLRADIWLPIAVIAALVFVAVLQPRLKPGPYVERVTIVNHTAYAFDVEVADKSADDWLPLGTTDDHSTVNLGSVFDQGSTWTFRFSVEGTILGTVVESRSNLASAGWDVEIPQRFADQIHSEGVAPTG
jgi:hypothetical protein